MQHWGSTQLLINLLRGFGLTCRIHGLPYEYQSLWPSSLLCLLCDWSFLASAGWRSALHLLPSSHQIRTGSKERKVRKDTKTEAPGMGGGKPIFELFSGIQGVTMKSYTRAFHPLQSATSPHTRHGSRNYVHRDLKERLIKSWELKTTLSHP